MKVIATNNLFVFKRPKDSEVIYLDKYNADQPVDMILLFLKNILRNKSVTHLKNLYNIIKTYHKSVKVYILGISTKVPDYNFNKYISIYRDETIKLFLKEIISPPLKTI